MIKKTLSILALIGLLGLSSLSQGCSSTPKREYYPAPQPDLHVITKSESVSSVNIPQTE